MAKNKKKTRHEEALQLSEKMVDLIEEKITEWLKENEYKSIQDIKQDSSFGVVQTESEFLDSEYQEEVKVRRLVSQINPEKAAYYMKLINFYTMGYIIESKHDLIEYDENKGTLNFNVLEYIEEKNLLEKIWG